jgi:pyruvate dehydrogenase E2 component (dihydrolipoamide acetyltransferase)
MPTTVIMPKFEMAQETGTVSHWLKGEGDSVEKGEAILEVETDKVNMEVEAPASGILVGIRAEVGAVVPIGQAIAYILQPGESWPEAKGDAPLAPTTSPSPHLADAPAGRVTPLAGRIAETHGIDLRAVQGTGSKGRVTRKDVETYLVSPDFQPAQPEQTSGRVKAVPAARRMARELNIPLETLAGSGPGGRIQSDDVRNAAAARSTTPVTVPPGQPAVRHAIPLTGMRRTVAERMTASVRQAPQFTASVDVNMSRALAIVDDLRQVSELEDGPKVTLTTFLVKACGWALTRHPALNAALEGENILEWEEINIGVAVAVQEGLVVPVIHEADQLGIRDVAERLLELSIRARERRLRPEDVQGGTFTLSNLGMLGIDRFTAILNPPQAGILAVGRVSKRPMVEEDQVVIRPMATFTLTADHRVVDGWLAGSFLVDLQHTVEHPGLLL